MAPERIRSGGASPEDDVYALGLTLWEMWTCRVPEPGLQAARQADAPADHVRRAGGPVDRRDQAGLPLPRRRPAQRLPARHLRFFNPSALTTNPIQLPRERLDPGPPPGRNAAAAFSPGQQSLLATFATNSPDFVGEVIPLDQPGADHRAAPRTTTSWSPRPPSAAVTRRSRGPTARGSSTTSARPTARTSTTPTSARSTSASCTAARCSSASSA